MAAVVDEHIHSSGISVNVPAQNWANENNSLVLLLYLLFNLTDLTVFRHGPRADKVYRAIASTSDISQGPRVFLTHLKEVKLLLLDEPQEIAEYDDNTNRTMFTIGEIAQVPSLESITVRGFCQPDEDYDDMIHNPEMVKDLSPNLRKLSLVNSWIGAKAVFELLDRLPSLESFSYLKPSMNDYHRKVDNYWVCQALRMKAGTTLQQLIFLDPSETPGYLGDITRFKTLRYIEVHVKMLFRGALHEKDVAKNLPHSIETIILHEVSLMPYQMMSSIDYIFVNRELHDLKRIMMVTPNGEDDFEAAHIFCSLYESIRQFEARGIALSTVKASDYVRDTRRF